MKKNHLIVLVVVAVVALAAALWLSGKQRPSTELGTGEVLVPGLRDNLNDLTRVRLSRGEGEAIATLELTDTGWGVAERGGYAADLPRVRELLLKLSEARLIEEKTSNPDLYDRLGVADPTPEGNGVLLELEGLPQPARIILGNFHGQAGDGTFVRRAGEARSWLASGNLTVDRSTSAWLRRELMDIASSRIARVEVEHADGDRVVAVKAEPGQGNFRIDNLPEGRQPSSEFVANGLASLLANLRIDDAFGAADRVPPEGAGFRARLSSFDGIEVAMTGWEAEGLFLARFELRLNAEQASARIATDQARAAAERAAVEVDAEAEAAEAATDEALAAERDQRLAALAAEVAAIQAAVSDWTFALPAFKFSNINKRMEELLLQTEAAD